MTESPRQVDGRYVWECSTCHTTDVLDGMPTRRAPHGWWPTVEAEGSVHDYTQSHEWLCPECSGGAWHGEAHYWKRMANDLERQRAVPVGRGFGSRRPR
jgi:hypothetical protein